LTGGKPFGRGGFGTSYMGKTIGSIKNKQINYSTEHTFFNTQVHMNPKAQAVRPIVKSEIDKDLLGTKPSRWNPSVSLPRAQAGAELVIGGKFKELDNKHQQFMIKHGFADEKITKADSQTTYAGCDTRDVYYHGWDVSIETTPPRDKERQYQIERAFLLDKTARTANRLIKQTQGNDKTVYGIKTNKYIRPEEIST
jgi:hypothetical protein